MYPYVLDYVLIQFTTSVYPIHYTSTHNIFNTLLNVTTPYILLFLFSHTHLHISNINYIFLLRILNIINRPTFHHTSHIAPIPRFAMNPSPPFLMYLSQIFSILFITVSGVRNNNKTFVAHLNQIFSILFITGSGVRDNNKTSVAHKCSGTSKQVF